MTSSINNLIMGKLYIEHTGIMKITNVQSSMVAKIKFKESGRLSSKDAHQVRIKLIATVITPIFGSVFTLRMSMS